jgi:hypothetical protein
MLNEQRILGTDRKEQRKLFSQTYNIFNSRQRMVKHKSQNGW